jgi:hypothetical protein
MKNCPTCGQPLLPSMGDIKAVKVAPSLLTLTLQIGQTVTSLKVEETPRGYRAQHVIKREQRYRLRFNIVKFPRKGTLGGRLKVIPLGGGSEPTVYELQGVPVLPLDAPFSAEFKVEVSFGGGEVIPISARLSSF